MRRQTYYTTLKFMQQRICGKQKQPPFFIRLFPPYIRVLSLQRGVKLSLFTMPYENKIHYKEKDRRCMVVSVLLTCDCKVGKRFPPLVDDSTFVLLPVADFSTPELRQQIQTEFADNRDGCFRGLGCRPRLLLFRGA